MQQPHMHMRTYTHTQRYITITASYRVAGRCAVLCCAVLCRAKDSTDDDYDNDDAVGFNDYIGVASTTLETVLLRLRGC